MSYTRRITPANPEPDGSRLDSYERSDGAKLKGKRYNWYDDFRSPKKRAYEGLPPRLDIEIVEDYNLKTIIFGNWVKQFDRLNFCATLKIALEDLQIYIFNKKKITSGLGKKILTIDWGGRGKKGALGTYNNFYTILHLRRFTRPDKLLQRLAEIGQDTEPYLRNYFEPIKGQSGATNYQLNNKGYIWALGSSGFGSFAHEYGHFLDNYIGRKLGAKDKFISGRGVMPVPPYKSTELTLEDIRYAFCGSRHNTPTDAHYFMFTIFVELYYIKKIKNTIFGKEEYYIPSVNLENLVKYCQRTGGKETYWLSFIEVWARLFETYTQIKLDAKGIENTFLVGQQKKFEIQVKVVDGIEITKEVGQLCYPLPSTVKKVSKQIDEILDIFATL
jgi:hypothetical protein